MTIPDSSLSRPCSPRRPGGRCGAFTAAIRHYGVPSEVLTDNGGQFTGRHSRPQPVEVLFERICRENGITQRRTKGGVRFSL